MKKYFLASLILSATSYAASIDHIQTYSPDYLANQAQNGMINAASTYYNPAGTAYLEEGKYVNAGIQYAMGHEKMSYMGSQHKARLRQAVPNLAFTSVGDKGSYFINFGGIAGGGKLKYKGVAGLDLAIQGMQKKISETKLPMKIFDNGTTITGSNKYEQLTFGKSFKFNDKLSYSVAARLIHGTRNLKGDLNIDYNMSKFFRKTFKKKLETLQLNGGINSKREAWGYGFQLGVNYKASEKLNLAARYDSRIKMNFKAKGNEQLLSVFGKELGFSTFYPQYTIDSKLRRDLPAILAIGASYKVTDNWTVSTAGNLYFNRHAKMDRITRKDGEKLGRNYKNGWELALGNEYKVNDKITLISSINYAKTGAKAGSYNDTEYALDSTTLGAGVRYSYDETLDLTLSAARFIYKKSEGTFKEKGAPKNQTYHKAITAVGVSFTKKF